MPYKTTAAIQVKGETRDALAKYKNDGESWDRFFIRVFRLAEQEDESQNKSS
jgi:hypothetical protein